MKIGLLGHGVVGSGVRKMIDKKETSSVADLEVSKILVKDEWEMTEERMTQNIDDILNDPEIDIVCECMGGLEPAHTFVLNALKKGKHCVTSNKKMLAVYAEELFRTAAENNVSLCYEASVGGGIPWIHELEHVARLEKVTSFRGIFNGTTNYILSKMAIEGKDYGVMLKEAQKLGYAERDPSDDVNGPDVCYKTCLSALTAFHAIIDPKQVPVYGINNITFEDIAWARENGYACKLIGSGKNNDTSVSIFVRPMMLKKEDVFASVPLNFNIIESNSETLGRAAYFGQGAGSLPTAHAVVQDLVDIVMNQTADIKDYAPKPVDCSDEHGNFYIRTDKLEMIDADVIERLINDRICITKKMMIKDLEKLIEKVNDPKIFVAEVSND